MIQTWNSLEIIKLNYNSDPVANAPDVLVPTANGYTSLYVNLSCNCSAHSKKSQPSGGGKALTSQVKKYNVSLQQRYCYISLVIQSHLMLLRKTLI